MVAHKEGHRIFNLYRGELNYFSETAWHVKLSGRWIHITCGIVFAFRFLVTFSGRPYLGWIGQAAWISPSSMPIHQVCQPVTPPIGHATPPIGHATNPIGHASNRSNRSRLQSVQSVTPPSGHAANRSRLQSVTPPIGHASNRSRLQSVTPPIGHASNRSRLQSVTPPIGHASNRSRHQSVTPPIGHASNRSRRQSVTPPVNQKNYKNASNSLYHVYWTSTDMSDIICILYKCFSQMLFLSVSWINHNLKWIKS